MATWKGLEPSTSSVTGWHSNQLNYQAAFIGGSNRARTCDPLLVRQMLSQLSYTPTSGAGEGDRTLTAGLEGQNSTIELPWNNAATSYSPRQLPTKYLQR